MTRPTITAYDWVPPFAQGQVRDLRVRWALEEVGQAYDVLYLSQGEQKQAPHRGRQPFGQVPTYEDGDLILFESGAIVLHIAETFGRLLPSDPGARARAIEWMFSALNTVEPPIMDMAIATLFEADKPWSKPRLPSVEARIDERFGELSNRLGEREWLDGDTFTAGDLMMVAVLRILEGEGLVEKYPNLTAYVARGTARPAFRRALDAQMAGFTGEPPEQFKAWLEKMEKEVGTMSYFQGFVIPVPEGKKQAYLDLAAKAAPAFAELGAIQTVECWEEDVPDGKRTDLRRAVKAEAGEKIVYSWVWCPTKATCDASAEKIMNDERMKPDGEMPFDGARMIYAGFEPAYDSGENGSFGFVDAFVSCAPSDSQATYGENSKTLDTFFLNEGAIRTVDGWGVDVPEGKVTDFQRAVAAEAGETVVFGWIEWPDKATRDAAFGKMMQDPEMQAVKPVFDMQRAIFGGFTPILDTNHQ